MRGVYMCEFIIDTSHSKQAYRNLISLVKRDVELDKFFYTTIDGERIEIVVPISGGIFELPDDAESASNKIFRDLAERYKESGFRMTFYVKHGGLKKYVYILRGEIQHSIPSTGHAKRWFNLLTGES